VTSLDELEHALVEAVGYQPLAGGLADPGIDRLLACTGLDLPLEVRAWYRRHDGARPASRVHAPWLIGHWLPLPLDEALAERERRHAMALEDLQGQPDRDLDDVWEAGWLPLFRTGNGVILVVDCMGSGPGGPSELLRVSRIAPDPHRVPSLEALFAFFVHALSTHAWSWDPARRRWIIDRTALAGHPLGLIL
jgi:cell wall assembly regulator SMI1